MSLFSLAAGLLVAPPVSASAEVAGYAKAPVLGWSAHTFKQLRLTERATGLSPGVLGVFTDFTTNFPAEWAQVARVRDVPLVVAWEPWRESDSRVDQPDFALSRVAAGEFDEYASGFALDAAGSGANVIIRFAPEMNGDWQVWNKGDTSADFVAAWRHLHDLFASVGATGVKWAFTPISTWPGGPAYESWWPGGDYVDWLGVDGYQWAGVLPRRGYESAAQVFTKSVSELRQLAPELPLMISETAAPPRWKSRWLYDLAALAPALGVSFVVWFEYDKETDWRLSSHSWKVPLAQVLSSSGWVLPAPLGR